MNAEMFEAYLRSVVNGYKQWWRLYTLTDATSKSPQQLDPEPPTFFDFGLMVQTAQPQKSEQERESELDEQEKSERLPVLEGICKYAAEHVLLVGRPGSGKSTALARLLLQEAEKALSKPEAKIPVLVELRYLPSEANELSVIQRIKSFILKHDSGSLLDEAGIKQLLLQGRFLLFMDGVNELPSDSSRIQVNLFRELYQKTCPMIFTTRALSVGGDLGIAKKLEMQPLTEAQMQQFAIAYLPTQGEKLLRQLSGRLREFGQTPLLLWMLCSLFQQSEQIPPNLGLVFRAFTVGYGDRIKQDVTLSKDSRAWWGRLLQYLAFRMTCGENLTELQVVISRREAEQILVEFLRGKVEFADDLAVRWLEDLLKHHLIQISNDRIEFRHQLIQEYYAAEWLLGLLKNKQISYERLQQDYLNYLKWTEPVALMLELVESEEQAVRVVRLALAVDLRLGARLAGAVKYGFQEKTVGLLIQEIDEREIPKLYAIKLLEQTGSDIVLKALILTFKDGNRDVRDYTAYALGKIGNDDVIELLIQFLKDEDPNVRENAAYALGITGNEKAIEPLIQAVKDENKYVIRYVKYALRKISGDRVIEALIQALKDKHKYVRRNVVNILSEIGSDKAIVPLIKIIKGSSKDPDMRRNVVCALGEIGSDKAVETLIQALKDNDHNVRNAAIRALGEIGSDKAIVPLIQIVNSTPKVSSFRQRIDLGDVAKALGKIGSDRAIEFLIQSLRDQNANVRHTIAKVLGKIGSDRVIEPLIQSLTDQDSKVRSVVVKALGEIGSDKAIEPLEEALRVENENNIIWDIVVVLGKLGSKEAIEALIDYLKNNSLSPILRGDAAIALGGIGSNEAIEPLIKSINDLNEDTRWKVVNALGKIGSEKAVQPLIHALSNNDADMRGNIIEALGNIGSDQAVQSLIDALVDNDQEIRVESSEALIKIANSDRNLPTLTQQLPYLLTFIPTESSQQALSVIIAIQARCKYYNYAIAQTPLQEIENHANPVEKISQEIYQTLKTMSEAGKYNIKAEVVQIVENNSGEVIGKKYANDPDPVLLQTINEITQVLAKLQKDYPNATKDEAKDIIEAEFKEIQNNQPKRWATFRQQLLNPERWLNGGKATISEIAKHYAENSVFLKAGVAFLDGFSADEE